MSNIDTSSWKEFRLDELFEKIKTEKISGKASDFPTCRTDEYTIPLLTAGADNQGFARYAKRNQCPTILKNVISISANGANTGVTFYQKDEFAVLQDAYAIKLRDMEIPNEHVGLFLASCISKILHGNFSWTYKAGWERIKGMVIKLPVKEVEEIDWEYMQERIAELEQERIAELEQYLIATGLNDYELTDEDKDILATKLTDGGVLRNSISGNGCLKEARMFRVGDLFESSNGDADLQKSHINGIGYNVVSSGLENNGIIGKTDASAKIFNADTITIDMFGNCFYRDEKYKMVTHARVFSLSPLFNKLNNLSGQYIISQFKYLPNVYNYSNMCSWNKIKDDMFLLPIQTDINNTPVIDRNHTYHPNGYIPDWTYMEKYIRAIEKVIIKDVVDYKDSIIAKTKEIVA